MSDIQILFPDPSTVLVGRMRLKVHPVRLADFEAFGKAAQAIFQMLNNCTTEELFRYASSSGTLRTVLMRCTSAGRWGLLGRWWIGRLPAAVAVELMIHVLQVNSDFFGQALGAAVNTLDGLKSSTG